MIARIVVVSLLVSGTAVAERRHLSVDEAVQAAIDGNPRLRAARARVDAAHDTADSIRGHYLPAIDVSDEWQHYNGAFAIPFRVQRLRASSRSPGELLGARPEHQHTRRVSGSAPARARPYRRGSRRRAGSGPGRRGAGEVVRSGDLVRRCRLQFLRLFEARATEDIARTSQAQLSEQLSVA